MNKPRCVRETATSRRSFLQFAMAMAPMLHPALGWAVSTKEEDVAGAMVDTARKHLHETDWKPRPELGQIPVQYYCNIFVADMAREAGGAVWDPISRNTVFRHPDPLAREWEDQNFIIKGWKVVFHAHTDFGSSTAQVKLRERKPGDIVAGLGHVGIVSEVAQASLGDGSFGHTISAAADSGSVVQNDWSFRLPDQGKFNSAQAWESAAKDNVRKFTVRRFMGV